MPASLNLDYRPIDDIDVAFDIAGPFKALTDPVQEWNVELRADDDFGVPVTLARATVFAIPHARFRDDIPEIIHQAAPQLDVVGVDITFAGAIAEKHLGDGDSLLLVERIVVEPQFRGRDLSHMIITAAQTFLLREGHGATALLPRPIGSESPGGGGELRLSRHFRGMGFRLAGASLVMTT
jgi:GNAT superfamily N-acetyltransferase